MNIVELLGEIQKGQRIKATPYQQVPGIGTGSAYAAGDAFGARFSFPVPKSGIIETAIMLDLDDEGANTELWLFRESFTATADNSAFAVSDGDLEFLEAVISIVNFADAANNRVGIANNLGLAYRAPKGELWCQCVTRGVPNIATAQTPKFALRILSYEEGGEG